MNKMNFITGEEIENGVRTTEKGLTYGERINLFKKGLRNIEPPRGIEGQVFMATCSNSMPYDTYLKDKGVRILDLARNGLRFNQAETTLKSPQRLSKNFISGLSQTFTNFTKPTTVESFESYYEKQIVRLLEEFELGSGRNLVSDVAITRPILSSNENVYYYVVAKTHIDTLYIKYLLRIGA